MRPSPLQLCCALLTLLLVGGLVSDPAFAQDGDGVRVDPRTPAGTEYAIPLEQARREAGAGGAGSAPASGSQDGQAGAAPLFGAGIDDGRKQAHRTKQGRGAAAKRSSQGSAAHQPPRSAALAATASGGSSALETSGIVLAVLAVGAAIGLGLRRMLRGS